MPKKEEHHSQYISNKELLSAPVFDLDSTQHYDWIVTIVFYCAVHLIEEYLAKVNGYDSVDHFDRKLRVLAEAKLRPISSVYLTLYIQSIRARYKCQNITKDDAIKAFKVLTNVEKAVS